MKKKFSSQVKPRCQKFAFLIEHGSAGAIPTVSVTQCEGNFVVIEVIGKTPICFGKNHVRPLLRICKNSLLINGIKLKQKLGKPTHKYVYRDKKVFSNGSVWEKMPALSWGNCSHYMCFLVLMERQIEPKLRWPSYLNDPFKMLSVSRLFFYKWVQC